MNSTDAGAGTDVAALLAAARAVTDPEIPVLTLGDLGIVRDLRVGQDGTVVVEVTPTYVGCPATELIAGEVRAAVGRAGAERVEVRTVLSPAWSTDWISAEGRDKLREYGIAPPGAVPAPRPGGVRTGIPLPVLATCPRCGSTDTTEVSRFGSTPCKALWTCRACAEPFDSFKEI